TCFSSIDAAIANETTGTTSCAATDVTAIQASITVPAPLLFWSLLPGGETRRTTVASYAVAGMSAPLCTGCGIVPIGVQAPDTSLATDATAYAGNGRRIFTVAIVNSLATDTTCGSMTVLGFRQFLLNPGVDGFFNAADLNGSVAVLYLGSIQPLPQGWFDTR